MTRHFIFIFAIIINIPALLATSIIEISSPHGNADATPLIRQAIERAAATRAHTIVIKPGTYHLYRENAAEKFLHVPNHDDGLRRIAFDLSGFKNLRIEGTGANLVCHEQIIPFLVSDCEAVIIAGISIDWANPFFLQGKVTAIDSSAGIFEIETLEECRATLNEGQLLFGQGVNRNREGWWQNIEWTYWVDPETKAAANAQPRLVLWNNKLQRPATFAALDVNRFSIADAADRMPEAGSVLICKGTRELNRISPAFFLRRSSGVIMRDIKIYHAGGMGVIAERCADVTLQRVRVQLPPDGKRLVSTTADATHFLCCKGQILVEECLFENMLDDAINVHGVYARVTEQSGCATLGARIFHHQQKGIQFAKAGERISFTEADTLLAYGERTVKSIRAVNDSLLEIEFTEPFDGFLRPNTALQNMDCQPSFVFRNNHIRNNRARGVLVTTASSVLIEDNIFERQSMMNILIEADCDIWHESGPVSDVTIRRNTFIGHHPALAAINISPKQPGEKRQLPPYHGGIRILENRFETHHPLLVQANRVKGFLFENNEIKVINRNGKTQRPADTFKLQACEDIIIRNNIFDHQNPPKIGIIPKNTPVVFENNETL